MVKILCSLLAVCLFEVAMARPDQSYRPAPQQSYRPQPQSGYEPEQYEPKPYQFDYGVQDEYSGANFGHQETSDGKVVTGSYTVALPDGRIQRVTYTADHINGFQAEVTYEGEARYDAYEPKQQQQQQQQSYRPAPKPQQTYEPEPRPQQNYRPRYN